MGSDTQAHVVLSLSADPSSGAAVIFPKRRITLNRETSSILVGRASRSTMKGFVPAVDNAWFNSAIMSRTQAKIAVDMEQKKVVINDLQSMHGTFLNGDHRVSAREPRELEDGDVIQFGVPIWHKDQNFKPTTVKVGIEFVNPDTSVSGTFQVPDVSDDDSEPANSDDELVVLAQKPRTVNVIDLTNGHNRQTVRQFIDLSCHSSMPSSPISIRDDPLDTRSLEMNCSGSVTAPMELAMTSELGEVSVPDDLEVALDGLYGEDPYIEERPPLPSELDERSDNNDDDILSHDDYPSESEEEDELDSDNEESEGQLDDLDDEQSGIGSLRYESEAGTSSEDEDEGLYTSDGESMDEEPVNYHLPPLTANPAPPSQTAEFPEVARLLNSLGHELNFAGRDLNSVGRDLNIAGQDLNVAGQDLNSVGQRAIQSTLPTEVAPRSTAAVTIQELLNAESQPPTPLPSGSSKPSQEVLPADSHYEQSNESADPFKASSYHVSEKPSAEKLGAITGKADYFMARQHNRLALDAQKIASLRPVSSVHALCNAVEPNSYTFGPAQDQIVHPLNYGSDMIFHHPVEEDSVLDHAPITSPPDVDAHDRAMGGFAAARPIPAPVATSAASVGGKADEGPRRTPMGIPNIVDTNPQSRAKGKRKADDISTTTREEERWEAKTRDDDVVKSTVVVCRGTHGAAVRSELAQAPPSPAPSVPALTEDELSSESAAEGDSDAVVAEEPAATAASERPAKRARVLRVAERLGYAALGGVTAGAVIMGTLIYTAPTFS